MRQFLRGLWLGVRQQSVESQETLMLLLLLLRVQSSTELLCSYVLHNREVPHGYNLSAVPSVVL